VEVRIHGNVSYSVNIDNWPDPEYDMDLDFVQKIRGNFTGVAGHEIRGTYQESPARNCAPPCHIRTASHAMIQLGEPRVASASHIATGLGFRSKVALEGIAGAVLNDPFPFDEDTLTVDVAMVPTLQGFNEIVGRSTVRVPMIGLLGARKLNVPVTCRVPGELLGILEDEVTVTVMQPVKMTMLAG